MKSKSIISLQSSNLFIIQFRMEQVKIMLKKLQAKDNANRENHQKENNLVMDF